MNYKRLEYFAQKSNEDPRAEKIFAYLANNFRRQIKENNSQYTYPEIKNGKFDWQELIRWKRSWPKIEVGSFIRSLRP